MTSALSIRQVEDKDITGILEIYNPIILNSPITYEEVPLTQSEMKERIQKYIKNYPWLVAVNSEGVVAGYAYGSQHRERSAYRWCVDVSAYVQEAFRGQKIGTRLYTELFGILARQNYIQAFAGINLPNDASVRLHESLGFKKIGVYTRVGFKCGQWHDAGWWQKELTPPPSRPAEPIPYSQLTKY